MANQETGAVATHDKTTFLEGALSVTAKLDSFLNQEVEGGRIPVTNTMLNRLLNFGLNNPLIRAAVKPLVEVGWQRIAQLKKQGYGFLVW